MPADDDPFDTLFSLEDEFYKEGYDLGVSDGTRAGLVEGRLFGLEKGFEKYVAMGALHGRATVWAGRLPNGSSTKFPPQQESGEPDTRPSPDRLSVQENSSASTQVRAKERVPPLKPSNRLETHIRTLYALVEPGSLSTANTEDSVSDFDDRLKRAEGKVKIIEKLAGESTFDEVLEQGSRSDRGRLPVDVTSRKGDTGSIEDMSSLHARH